MGFTAEGMGHFSQERDIVITYSVKRLEAIATSKSKNKRDPMRPQSWFSYDMKVASVMIIRDQLPVVG